MSLLRLYSLTEAGVENDPTKDPRKKKSFFKHANGGGMSSPQDDDEGDEEDLGPDLDYDDPSPGEPDDEPEPVRPAKPFKEPEREVPFAKQSAKPSPALQGGKTAGSVKADRMTLSALERALENVRTGDDDLQAWIDDLLSEIGRAIRSGGDLTLPKFVAAPDDDVDDGGLEDEDY